MAPLPDNNTGVIFVHYTAQGHTHTTQVRYPEAANPGADVIEDLDQLLTLLGPVMPTDFTFISWEWRAAGTNFTVPLAGTPTELSGVLTPVASYAPAYFNFIGRSSGGRRVRLGIMGAGWAPIPSTLSYAEDYRVDGSENADMQAIIDWLNQANFRAIDGLTVTWKPYVNVGYNAYWQRAVRT